MTTDKLAGMAAIVKKSPVFRLWKSGNPRCDAGPVTQLSHCPGGWPGVQGMCNAQLVGQDWCPGVPARFSETGGRCLSVPKAMKGELVVEWSGCGKYFHPNCAPDCLLAFANY